MRKDSQYRRIKARAAKQALTMMIDLLHRGVCVCVDGGGPVNLLT